jgi:hypothetical protein
MARIITQEGKAVVDQVHGDAPRFYPWDGKDMLF